MGLGFTIALTLLGLIREMLGNVSAFGLKPEFAGDGMLAFVLAPGGFIVLGFLIALVNVIKNKSAK
jgi:electron transport complex protein RnfE